ncbi:UDP-glucuronosyl/UDP-glucosyltransferase [Purpureocillium lavendulum]|uniref:UDP-glucuronosyl/UDP-glucosyltransferase n=1 Tax=Purpureocillium lavendulum TaxID=1247861 RepID=A0AB34G470_9HYPO|nr:UDP-glucuronosyl/UDP-glucosyltransferase [Purpureocillium lavendulum]
MTVPGKPGKKNPLLFFTSFPGEGHTNPVLAIAASMVTRGYDVTYLCSPSYRERITEIGAEYLELPWDLNGPPVEGELDREKVPIGLDRAAKQLSHVFYHALPIRVEAIRRTLEELRARDPSRQIIMIEDAINMGSMPFRYGKPLPQGFDAMPRTIGISPTPLMVRSKDTAPFLLGLPPDSSDSGRQRNEWLQRLVHDGPFKPLVEAWRRSLKDCGCTVVPSGSPLSAWYEGYDNLVMLCSPSLEYKLSDMPSSIEFAGCLPRRGISKTLQYPEWWPEVMGYAQSADKKIVFVSQGTVNMNWSELLIPTMRAFADRDDVLVIAALGRRGAALDASTAVPSNARVIDYFPYDALLPLADVFVSNAGYGAFCHAVTNGVPGVFAGQTEDKSEVSMRGEWAGFAVNMRTQRPGITELREAVETVFQDKRFKARAVELKDENEALDCLTRIEQVVERWVE